MGATKCKKSILALLICFTMILSVFITINAKSSGTSSNITIYYKGEYKTPYVYYWNSLPDNLEVDWPGEQMIEGSDGWFTYTFNDITKINLLFNDGNGNQTKDLKAEGSSKWWYNNGTWTDEEPSSNDNNKPDSSTGSGNSGSIAGSTTGSQLSDRTDFREETIYFLMTTRFFDGYLDNNVHCWDECSAQAESNDPAWRGDFQGLIDKLDYIKALGFSAIWITPVVENASGFDYHGYHAVNFSKVDSRYESPGATYQDLIDACHDKGIKIIQDVVYNHTGNWGESNLFPMFSKNYSNLGSSDCMIPNLELLPSNYISLKPEEQYNARIKSMKNIEDQGHDDNYVYHHYGTFNWDEWNSQQAQIAGDCVDLNTENPYVYNYLNNCYTNYMKMGVDAFRVDTTKHISRLTWNKAILPELIKAGGDDFYMFGEVCARANEVWYRGTPGLSTPFYTWKESKEYGWTDDADTNIELTKTQYDDNADTGAQPTSNNAFLDGNDYHAPDTSMASKMNVIDFPMHWNFMRATGAFNTALGGDQYYNDATWNVVYVDSHDYGPDECQRVRYEGGTDAWAENLDLMFTFRGIPCIYYGSEIEFQKGVAIDEGPAFALEDTGRAYYGDYLEGDVKATDFGEYTASGTVAETLNYPLAQHIIRLNKIRRAIPALQKGQYSVEGVTGDLAFKRRYTEGSTDSFVCVSITGDATFTGIPSGKYVDVITGDTINSSGTLKIPATSKGNMRVYVLNGTGKIGEDGTYLK